MPKPLLFYILLAAHLLGDFYFQSQALADAKKRSAVAVIKHCLYYGALMAAVLLLFYGLSCLRVLACAAISHAVIDLLKFHCREQLWAYPPKWVFIVDQLLHLTVLAALAAYSTLEIRQFAFPYGQLFPYPGSDLLRFGCLVLFLGKPCNLLLKFCNLKPGAETKQTAADFSAGAVIGTLERLLTAILFLLKQYGAISVAFAAKTLTRYPRMNEDPNFSEYYLIGTLGSLLLSIAATLFFFPPA